MFELANRIEAVFWIVLGIGTAVAAFSKKLEPKRLSIAVATVLIAFGLSDLVEVRTGAWWRPWWLLLWKATCVVLLFSFGLLYWKQSKKP